MLVIFKLKNREHKHNGNYVNQYNGMYMYFGLRNAESLFTMYFWCANYNKALMATPTLPKYEIKHMHASI